MHVRPDRLLRLLVLAFSQRLPLKQVHTKGRGAGAEDGSLSETARIPPHSEFCARRGSHLIFGNARHPAPQENSAERLEVHRGGRRIAAGRNRILLAPLNERVVLHARHEMFADLLHPLVEPRREEFARVAVDQPLILQESLPAARVNVVSAD